MSSYLDYETELRAVVAETWSEVKANGIWWNEQISDIPFAKFAEANQLPLAVATDAFEPTSEWGADCDLYEGEVSVFYVAHTSTPRSAITPKLEALVSALRSGEFDHFQVVELPRHSKAGTLPANKYFAQFGLPFRAGVVMFRAVYGSTPE